MDILKLQIPHSHFPYGEEGSGLYSEKALTSFDSFKEIEGLLLEAVDQWKYQGGNFCMVDYGTADGGTSMPVFHSVIRRLRELHGEELPIVVNYEDQPVNDFKSLFMRLQGMIPGPPSYLLLEKNVYIYACVTGFYSQCFPPNSVDLGLSATCLHWLSEKPCNLSGVIHPLLMTIPEEKEAFAKQAAKDWETILLQRAKELKRGAKLFLVQLAISDDGEYSGTTKYAKAGMLEVMNNIWKQMADEGKITIEEFHNTTLLSYHRTKEEFEAPFLDPESAVTKSGLRLVSSMIKIIRCRYHVKWLQEGGDPVAHAKSFVPAPRAWSNHSMYSGLSDSRTKEERKCLVDEFYMRYENIVASNPSDHAIDAVNAYIVIEKV